MLAFIPNFGRCPVAENQLVSVLTNAGSFFEGPASDFNWEDEGPQGVEGWREMLPGEVLHSEHRMPHRRGNCRVLKGSPHAAK